MIGLEDASTMNCSIQDTLPPATLITFPGKMTAIISLSGMGSCGEEYSDVDTGNSRREEIDTDCRGPAFFVAHASQSPRGEATTSVKILTA
jgi:hypothetical protein